MDITTCLIEIARFFMEVNMREINKRITAILIAMSCLAFSSCGNQTDNHKDKTNKNNTKIEENNEDKKEVAKERSIMALGTFITLKAMDGTDENIKAALDESIEKIREIENKVSINIESSEVSKINRNADEQITIITEDTNYLIKKSIYYSQLSNGAFDVSVYPLVKLWGIGTEDARIPSNDEISNALQKVSYENIQFNENEGTAYLKVKGSGIDLGAIAKGYVGDKVKEIFKEKNITSGFLNFGGNILVIGEKLDGSSWKIGIRNPRKESGEYYGIVSVKDKTIVTSGDYERYFEENGKRYHHIINPETGYPVENDLISTTIIADKSIDADALSTAVYVLGKEKGIGLLEEIDGIEGIFVTKDKKVYTTSGVGNSFRITDSSFDLRDVSELAIEKVKIKVEEKIEIKPVNTSTEENDSGNGPPVPKSQKEDPKVKVVEKKDEVDGNSEATD